MVFEGRSFALSSNGNLVGRAKSFEVQPFMVAVQASGATLKLEAAIAEEGSLEGDLWHALVLGVRDYIGKNGFPVSCLVCQGVLIQLWYWQSLLTHFVRTEFERS